MSQAFDVLEFSNELVDSGFTEQQAHVLAHGLWRWADSQLASKQDIRDLKEEGGRRLDEFRGEMDRRFDESRKEMDRRFDDFRGEMDRRFDDFREEMERRFEDFRMEVERRLNEMEARLRQEFREALAELKAELIKVVMVAVVVQSGIVAVLFKFLH